MTAVTAAAIALGLAFGLEARAEESWTAPAAFRFVRATAFPSGLTKSMREAIALGEARERNEESEHAYLGARERDAVAAWIREIEETADDFAWLGKTAVPLSVEDEEIIRRVNARMPWVGARNVFFLEGLPWYVLSGASARGMTVDAATGDRTRPTALIQSGLAPAERQFVLIHEGFHMKQRPLFQIETSVRAALGPASKVSPSDVSRFVNGVGEGRAQRNALALGRLMGMDVSPFAANYAQNVALIERLSARAGDGAVDSLLDQADASALLNALGRAQIETLVLGELK